MQTKQALILTLRMDSKSQEFFNAQRICYFPQDRNTLDAHLTIFHQLPNEPATYDFFAGLRQPSFQLQVVGLMNLGAGVAYSIKSGELQLFRKRLSDHFMEKLIPQDRQPYRPHITIMNKSTPVRARELLLALSKGFKMFSVEGIGVDLWTYLDGPWRHEVSVPFHRPDNK